MLPDWDDEMYLFGGRDERNSHSSSPRTAEVIVGSKGFDDRREAPDVSDPSRQSVRFPGQGRWACRSPNRAPAAESTLYCLDFENRQAVFVETPPEYNLSRAPFLYQAQYELASRLVQIPFETLHRLAAEVVIDPTRLILIYSVGRCGSTLVSHAFNALEGVESISEPDVFTQMLGQWGVNDLDGAVMSELLQELHAPSMRTGPEPGRRRLGAQVPERGDGDGRSFLLGVPRGPDRFPLPECRAMGPIILASDAGFRSGGAGAARGPAGTLRPCRPPSRGTRERLSVGDAGMQMALGDGEVPGDAAAGHSDVHRAV